MNSCHVPLCILEELNCTHLSGMWGPQVCYLIKLPFFLIRKSLVCLSVARVHFHLYGLITTLLPNPTYVTVSWPVKSWTKIVRRHYESQYSYDSWEIQEFLYTLSEGSLQDGSWIWNINLEFEGISANDPPFGTINNYLLHQGWVSDISGGWSKTRGSFGCMCLFVSLSLWLSRPKSWGSCRSHKCRQLWWNHWWVVKAFGKGLNGHQTLPAGVPVILPLASHFPSVFQASSSREDMKEQELGGWILWWQASVLFLVKIHLCFPGPVGKVGGKKGKSTD